MMCRYRVSLVAFLAATIGSLAAEASGAEPGIEARVPWTTSQVRGTPEPPLPYITERVFPQLEIKSCLDLAPMPGSDRLFVLIRGGKLFSFVPSDDVESADLAADLAKAIPGVRNTYSIVFHPDFAVNRYCYLCCVKKANEEDGSQIIRFRMRDSEPPTLDIDSATTVITWPSGGHNGCCLKFGPDGYLYISTGDGVGPNPPDTKQAGQDVTNLLSCIMRIDVNATDPGRNYRIPADNPFVNLPGVPGARGEIWAYGFRNPWRMSFDEQTGDLWVGDVGWELWEMLDRVERGGNYGWSIVEGRQPTNAAFPRGPTPILPPTIEHPHSESSSITDGLTYYGKRLAPLQGMHIYGDYDTGKIWAFRWTEQGVAEHREIADTTHRIASFGELPNGEFYIVDHVAGGLFRLVPNPRAGEPSRFPRRLSETGLFASVAEHQPAPGVIPYSINAEMWSDHATAERWVAIPGTESIQATKKETDWSYPAGSVLVRTLSLELKAGDPASRRRIETQLLHFDGIDWRPYSYRWNEAQTDAVLVDAGGDERTLEIADAHAPQGKRTQAWRFAGRAECQRCHNPWSGPPLGFHTAMLNRPHTYDATGQAASQLQTLAHIGLIQNLPPEPKHAQRAKLADPYNESADLESRARAYLHANCSHCHRKHAGGAVLSEMQHDIPLAKAKLLMARPTQGGFGLYDARVIAPGDPDRSVLHYRMAKLGGGRMPRLGSHVVDEAGVRLLREWIEQMPSPDVSDEETEISADTQQAVADLRGREQQRLRQLLESAADPQRTDSALAALLQTTSGALQLLTALDEQRFSPEAAARVARAAAKHEDVRVRDLFERFLPAEERLQRLGAVVQPEQILQLSGDARRGAEIFRTESNACVRCHQVGSQGGKVGPDLSRIGAKHTREELLESILAPSKRIDPKFVTHRVETDEGQVLAGLLVERNAEHVVLRDAQNKLHKLPAESVERLAPSAQSMMPELLFQNMTAQQAADLVAYLKSLR